MAASGSSTVRGSHVEGSMLRRPRHASSSSTGQIRFTPSSSLTLVYCPDCGEQIVQYVSRSKKNPNRVYYKCSNRTERNAPCDFWYWEECYQKYLIDHGLLNGDASREEREEIKGDSYEEDEVEDLGSKKKLIDVVLMMRSEVKQQTLYSKIAAFGIVVFGAVLLGMIAVVVAKSFL
uniref:GRF-type domain-containing protein n=1 Tax=Oryza glaberrima TaxID=4538 RepID=I1PB38_ORYGL